MRFCLLLCAATIWAETMPKGMRVSTWVREELFAGFLSNDMAQFGNGMKKTDAIIAADPKAADALAWRGGGELYLAVRALETGDRAQFDSLYKKALATFADAKAVMTPQTSAAVNAIAGGTFTLFADRLPEPLRQDGWQKILTHYSALREEQKPFFTKMPVHHQGEVLSGLAQAALRLADNAAATTLLETIITTLPSTPYEPFAKKALATMDAKAKIACLTCHDAGRLANWKAPVPKAD
ncbi:MAG: hypothetical protein FJW38_10875 [Acidobacteria bacterium]|nr:hypothetical protein [Acidobacteriota bacterium]